MRMSTTSRVTTWGAAAAPIVAVAAVLACLLFDLLYFEVYFSDQWFRDGIICVRGIFLDFPFSGREIRAGTAASIAGAGW